MGKERPTAQLVGVTLKNGGYSFDFSLMERYIRIMLKCGIKYFEHSHLFTQWGAKASPKIIADTESGKKRDIRLGNRFKERRIQAIFEGIS